MAPSLKSIAVRELLRRPVRTIRDDASLASADELLREYALSSLAVLDAEGAPVGVLSRTDLLRVGSTVGDFGRRHPLLALPDASVATAMTRGVIAVGPETPVLDAALELVRRHIHRVYVLEAGSLVGVVSTRELTELTAARRVMTPVAEHMTEPVRSVGEHEPASRAVEMLAEAKISGLVVLDADGAPTGIFTQVEALQARHLPAQTPVESVMSYAMLCLNVATPLYKAARYALDTRARRVVAVDRRQVCGVLTGLDFARALLDFER